ncbi:environmental stress-induced protein Ves [Pseudorhizobium tarimense]|uniref:Environmental stress-induced protein Ves n=1 Tax=Pseudorhizobium tarimense TaxID=1079109 RepID=A0ABV2HBK7_9HYPH|nr:HutD family protein [Pseudorhizobium tarimense]MCJ8520703.1 HutD family protein [Pseudorhizobium tarimense]
MKVLRAHTHKRMPWKNGRGETVEIAVFPQDANVDTFDWRISMATVTEDGLFSMFPGIDRTLSVIEGGFLELSIDGSEVRLLDASSLPYRFPADVATYARLSSGTIVDFNVMSRRNTANHHVEKLTLPFSFNVSGRTRFIFCLGSGAQVSCGEKEEILQARDAIMVEAGEAISVTGEGAVLAIAILPAEDILSRQDNRSMDTMPA